ncbi:hypothetical protein AAG565_01390 [Fontimonas sp. SYSU GA230001]|uniref:hypothetical protein n=1 Tax=Fontimonas sp. SYSU GA230001 TaxID=3142450 RepID=UPI0032B50250
MRTALAMLIAALCTPAAAADVQTLQIERAAPLYRMHLVARLDSPLAQSFGVFRDFSNLPRINDAIEVARSMTGATPGAQRLYTRIRVCVWFFCTHLDQVQDIVEVREHGALGLDARVIPELSNLRYGRARWRMTHCGRQTCLDFQAELEPDFWIPPLIGPWAIERAMRNEALQTAQGIERLARTGTSP